MISVKVLEFAVVGLGGGIGAMTRFAVEHLGIFDNDKYYYTVGINVTGCFIIGVLSALFTHLGLPRWWQLFFMTGILGGYTTYSAFTLDAMQLVQNGMVGRALFYVAITFVGGLGAAYLGLLGTEKICRMI